MVKCLHCLDLLVYAVVDGGRAFELFDGDMVALSVDAEMDASSDRFYVAW